MINSKFNAKFSATSIVFVLAFSLMSFAQTRDQKPTVVAGKDQKPMPVAMRNNVYCAGYIQNTPVNAGFEIVGGDDERDQHVYAQGDMVYLSQGSTSGVKVGDTYSVIRPKGQVKSKFTPKEKLGYFVEELGTVEIVRVRSNVSIGKVKTSCDTFLLGDLLQPAEVRTAPMFSQRPALDVFAEPTGKSMGRIIFSRDGREVLGREQIVYIDLGTEDNVKMGDYLTVFRPLGKGNVLNAEIDDTSNATDEAYGSRAYAGTEFSMQSPRKDGADADGKVVLARDAKKRRPMGLRKVVGEMVILSVKDRTATAMIVRNVQEIHTGDWVEVQ